MSRYIPCSWTIRAAATPALGGAGEAVLALSLVEVRRFGMNNCEIAAALYCSEGWVRLTRKRLVRKIAEAVGIL